MKNLNRICSIMWLIETIGFCAVAMLFIVMACIGAFNGYDILYTMEVYFKWTVMMACTAGILSLMKLVRHIIRAAYVYIEK